MDPVGIGVLVSGGGSNFEALVAAARRGEIPRADFRLLISNKPGAGALDRAARLGVPARVFDPKTFPDRGACFDAVADALLEKGVRVVCLAGFLLKVEPNFIRRFPGRILNIHPALLPKFGGKGMYGRHVHEAVLAAGEKESGCTVHLVDDEFDHGPAIARAKVPVVPGDTAEGLAARVLEQEHRLYPAALRQFLEKLDKVNK
ncbi:MAG: phosphoribosylglycinamide formyltransferase [Elusimicrobia bacterium]|nr:phosphoribosylglycinamide formyltransferase [Elusimicrobiota bacterium]MBK7544520.1 phosphoribosylglycinamide formyltransferase [Elusimicrobiota bacterium]MBK7574043.1 phosphoribosylglycinamide formyltransferase [Elusimicrobiota bacterium]MBK8126183.1 phosphoribosylglycinamide formyltransferase [Elusimicrobiota bacterium]MBK8422512.1 phosphoribosylglycinamide formyltransferase [Elusimicrobiota bacterium]